MHRDSVDVVVEAVRRALAVEDRSAAAGLLINSGHPRDVLLRLVEHGTNSVRAWIPGLAMEVLGGEAGPVLTKLLDDEDPDTRVMALAALEELDPERLSKEVVRLTRRLHSRDAHEALATAWILARIAGYEAGEAIRSARDSVRSEHWLYYALDAVLAFATDPSELIARLRAHDHLRMRWLAYGARQLGTEEAFAALEHCASTAEDERCRTMCRVQLETWDGPSES